MEPSPFSRAWRSWPFRLSVSVAAVAMATGAVAGLAGHVRAQFLPLTYIVAVLAVASLFGLRFGVAAAVASFLALNFFFIEPRFTFSVGEPADLIALAFFLVAAVLVGSLAGRLREVADRSERQANLLRAIADFTDVAWEAKDRLEILTATVRAVSRMTGGPVAIVRRRGEAPLVEASMPPELALDAAEIIQATRALDRHATESAVESGWDASRFFARPLRFGDNTDHVLLATHGLERYAGETDQFLDTLLDQTTMAVQRLGFAETQARAAAQIEEERLRSALLSSISHDLRTPLATILGAVTSIRELGDALAPATKDDLLEAIEQETRSLSRFVANLLDMTRLQSGVNIRLEHLALANFLGDVEDRLRHLFPGRRFSVSAAPIGVAADPLLLEQVFVNLAENAVRHSDAASTIVIDAHREGGKAVICLSDEGDGIPPADIDRVFDAFYRRDSQNSRTRGLGLGLALCRSIVTALGGTIDARSPASGGKGTRMEVRLPIRDPGGSR